MFSSAGLRNSVGEVYGVGKCKLTFLLRIFIFSKQQFCGALQQVCDYLAVFKRLILGSTTVEDRTPLQQRLTLDFDIGSIRSSERIHFAELRVWKSPTNNSQFNSLLSNKEIPAQCLTLFLYATQMRRDGTGREQTFVVS